MAEGFSGDREPFETEARATRTERFDLISWIVGTRLRILSLFAALVATILVSIVLWHTFAAPILDPPQAKIWFLTGVAALCLPLVLMMMDSPDNIARGPGLAIPLTTLFVLFSLVAVCGADRLLQLHLFFERTSRGGEAYRLAPLVAFFSFFGVAMAPRICNAMVFASQKEKDIRASAAQVERQRQSVNPTERTHADTVATYQQKHSESEAAAALIATLAILGICALALVAGELSQSFSLRNAVGVAISISVIGIFSVVVFLDWIADSPPVRSCSHALRNASRRMTWLAAFYNGIDTALVRIGAHVAGTEHHKIESRYGVLAGTMLSLAAMAWLLPAPLGLVPAIVGFVLAFSVSRIWSWVEEDRNLASITRFNPDAPKRVGFREDFRDETILGFVFVLLLIPIAMEQADAAQIFGQPLFDGADKKSLAAWFGYFGFELAKALPVVDWADIYNLKPGPDLLAPHGVVGLHSVFAARVTVDLVLIASLLQAIRIATRNRQQKALFAEGHIDRLDELVEKAELMRAMRRPSARRYVDQDVDFRRYNRDRLRELYFGSSNDRLKAFIADVFDKGGFTLDPAIITLTKVSIGTPNAGQLHRTLEAAKLEHVSGKYLASISNLIEVMSNLRSVSGLKDFKFEILRLASEIGSAEEFADMLERLIASPLHDDFKYTKIEAASYLEKITPQMSDPNWISNAITQIKKYQQSAFGSATFVASRLLETLERRLKELRDKRND